MERKLLLALCLGLATCFALGLPARAGDGEADAPGDAERMAPGDDAPAPMEEAAAGDPAPAAEGDVSDAEKEAEDDAAGKGEMRKSLAGALGLLAGISLVVLAGFSLFAFLLFMLIVFPGVVERVRQGGEGRPLFVFFLGLVNVIFVLVLVGALANGGKAGGVLSLVIFVAFLFVVVFGLSGRAQSLGARTLVLAERRPNPVQNLVVGWWILFLVGILPVVGWILFLYWAIAGVGGVLVSLFGKETTPAASAAGDGGIVVDRKAEDEDRPNYSI